jgi:hypothetical protein
MSPFSPARSIAESSYLCFCCCILQYKPEEITSILKDFDEPGTLAPTGLFLGGTKYMVIQGEAGAVIRGKKVHYALEADSMWSQ